MHPRGKYRTKLASKGLIGKVHLTSLMNDVENEIRSVFCVPMCGNNEFCFCYLQSTGTGSKTLTVVSSSFDWTAQQVAKLGNNKQAIYIMANDEFACSLDSEVCYLSMHGGICVHLYCCNKVPYLLNQKPLCCSRIIAYR